MHRFCACHTQKNRISITILTKGGKRSFEIEVNSKDAPRRWTKRRRCLMPNSWWKMRALNQEREAAPLTPRSIAYTHIKIYWNTSDVWSAEWSTQNDARVLELLQDGARQGTTESNAHAGQINPNNFSSLLSPNVNNLQTPPKHL